MSYNLVEIRNSLTRAKSNNINFNDDVAAKIALLFIDQAHGYTVPSKYGYEIGVMRFRMLAEVANALPEFFDDPQQWDKWNDEPESLEGLSIFEAFNGTLNAATGGAMGYSSSIKFLIFGVASILGLMVIRETLSIIQAK